jgi:hypothetical protein
MSSAPRLPLVPSDSIRVSARPTMATTGQFAAPSGATSISFPRLFEIGRSQVPEVVYLTEGLAPGWLLRQPIALNIEKCENGTYIASDDLFAVYGEGPDKGVAIEDYKVSLVEYYEIIEEEAASHSPSNTLLAALRLVIKKVKTE